MADLRHVHLDPLGGIAGDMFLAAILDAFPDLEPEVFAAMRAAGLPQAWRTELIAHTDHALAGKRLIIEPEAGAEGGLDGGYEALHRHLLETSVEPAVRDRAASILRHLATAEAAVHGVALNDVHFHELADWDSLADVVGAAAAIEALGAGSWSIAPLPAGSGRIRSRHGPLPVPAPATARLLEGFPVVDDGVAGERVTPTGAAIVRELQPGVRLPEGPWKLQASGFGFGSRRLDGVSNVLRALVYEAAEASMRGERVALVAFEVDDQTPEDLAVGLDALRRQEGVLDVLQMPAFGKKGRLAVHIQILARSERLHEVVDLCFRETTTIGLRWRIEARVVLDRARVMAGEGASEVKVVTRPGEVRTAKAEIDQVEGGGGHAGRTWRRLELEAEALLGGRDDPAD